MIVGLISDTHGHLDHTVLDHFRHCDEIWHAGDIGTIDIIDQLKTICPVRAVFGNIDDAIINQALPEDSWFTCEGMTVWMTHIGGAPPRYNPRINKILKLKVPDIFICGHTHILRVLKDDKLKFLYVNPGAAGNHGFHSVKTIIRMEIAAGKIGKLEVIELGKRGALK